MCPFWDRDSSFWPERSVDRIPVGEKCSSTFQPGPGAHPTFSTMFTGSFPGVKRSERGVDHPTLFSAEVNLRVQLYIYFPSRPP